MVDRLYTGRNAREYSICLASECATVVSSRASFATQATHQPRSAVLQSRPICEWELHVPLLRPTAREESLPCAASYCIDYAETNPCLGIVSTATWQRGGGIIQGRCASIQSHDGIRILHSKHSGKERFCVVKRERPRAFKTRIGEVWGSVVVWRLIAREQEP